MEIEVLLAHLPVSYTLVHGLLNILQLLVKEPSGSRGLLITDTGIYTVNENTSEVVATCPPPRSVKDALTILNIHGCVKTVVTTGEKRKQPDDDHVAGEKSGVDQKKMKRSGDSSKSVSIFSGNDRGPSEDDRYSGKVVSVSNSNDRGSSERVSIFNGNGNDRVSSEDNRYSGEVPPISKGDDRGSGEETADSETGPSARGNDGDYREPEVDETIDVHALDDGLDDDCGWISTPTDTVQQVRLPPQKRVFPIPTNMWNHTPPPSSRNAGRKGR
jgi:hypothetical protein